MDKKKSKTKYTAVTFIFNVLMDDTEAENFRHQQAMINEYSKEAKAYDNTIEFGNSLGKKTGITKNKSTSRFDSSIRINLEKKEGMFYLQNEIALKSKKP